MNTNANQKPNFDSVFSMARSMGTEEDLLHLNLMLGQPKRSWFERTMGHVKYWILSLRSTTYIEKQAQDMSCIRPLSGDSWVIASHTFAPLPWNKIVVMGSGLTLQSAREAYQLALLQVDIPERRWWMWWRRCEASVDTPFIGAGIT